MSLQVKYNLLFLSCAAGIVEDVYVVPVSISYEKLLDGNYNNEQMVLELQKLFRCFIQPYTLKI